jgi:hypothetical protein
MESFVAINGKSDGWSGKSVCRVSSKKELMKNSKLPYARIFELNLNFSGFMFHSISNLSFQ